jgi:hypothetical protein
MFQTSLKDNKANGIKRATHLMDSKKKVNPSSDLRK